MTTFDQKKQSVDKQFNVGRDQIIHNIVVVGQFLDFAKIEGLIPNPTESFDFKSVSAAFGETFGERLEGDLVGAVAFAGSILGDLLPNWLPQQSFEPIPFRKILPTIATHVATKLIELDYWETFCEKGYFIPQYSDTEVKVEVVFLDSLTTLWQKRHKVDSFPGNKLFGLAAHHKRHFFDYTWYTFVKLGQYVVEPFSKHKVYEVKFTNMGNEDARIFMAGLVIDLIRMASTVSTDFKFWHGLIDLLGSGKK